MNILPNTLNDINMGYEYFKIISISDVEERRCLFTVQGAGKNFAIKVRSRNI